MKGKKVIWNSSMLIVGIALITLGFLGTVDEFWSGMGSALFVMGCIRLLRAYRLNKNEVYREKMEIEINDERNHFIRAKAWSWTGYLFVIISSLCTIGFKAAGQDLLSQFSGFAVCLMIVLYWGSYMMLKKKY